MSYTGDDSLITPFKPAQVAPDLLDPHVEPEKRILGWPLYSYSLADTNGLRKAFSSCPAGVFSNAVRNFKRFSGANVVLELAIHAAYVR